MEEVRYQQTIFIGKPAQEVWQALTTKALVDQYYVVPLGTDDLKAGSEIFYGDQENKMITGKILEMEAPQVFAHSFQFAHNPDDPETVVRYTIEDMGDMSVLRLTHEGFSAENQTFHDVTGGWPVILSGLKTLLETGKPLPWPKPQ